MDSVEKIQADQAKARENQEHQGHGNPQMKKPNKQHTTNK